MTKCIKVPSGWRNSDSFVVYFLAQLCAIAISFLAVPPQRSLLTSWTVFIANQARAFLHLLSNFHLQICDLRSRERSLYLFIDNPSWKSLPLKKMVNIIWKGNDSIALHNVILSQFIFQRQIFQNTLKSSGYLFGSASGYFVIGCCKMACVASRCAEWMSCRHRVRDGGSWISWVRTVLMEKFGILQKESPNPIE